MHRTANALSLLATSAVPAACTSSASPQLAAALQHYASWVGSHCAGGHTS